MGQLIFLEWNELGKQRRRMRQFYNKKCKNTNLIKRVQKKKTIKGRLVDKVK